MGANLPPWTHDPAYWDVMRHAKLRHRQALKEELIRLDKSAGPIPVDRVDFVIRLAFDGDEGITDLMRIRDLLKAFPGADKSIMRAAALRCRDFRSLLLARKEFGMFTDSEIVSRIDTAQLMKVFNRGKVKAGSSRGYRDDKWIRDVVSRIPDLVSLLEVGKVLES